MNMKTKLNDNEVSEIAEMQKKIDSYEGFIKALFEMMKSNKSCCFPLFTDTNLEDEMHFIWKTTTGLCNE